MGTQHANEVSSNASIGAKFDASYPVFACDPMQDLHDAIVAKSLDLLRMGCDVLIYQRERADLPSGRAPNVIFFHANRGAYFLTRALHSPNYGET
jgi:hypothetical protein